MGRRQAARRPPATGARAPPPPIALFQMIATLTAAAPLPRTPVACQFFVHCSPAAATSASPGHPALPSVRAGLRVPPPPPPPPPVMRELSLPAARCRQMSGDCRSGPERQRSYRQVRQKNEGDREGGKRRRGGNNICIGRLVTWRGPKQNMMILSMRYSVLGHASSGAAVWYNNQSITFKVHGEPAEVLWDWAGGRGVHSIGRGTVRCGPGWLGQPGLWGGN